MDEMKLILESKRPKKRVSYECEQKKRVRFQRSPTTGTLNSPIIVGHNNFLEPILILTTRINVGHIKFSTRVKFLVENQSEPQKLFL